MRYQYLSNEDIFVIKQFHNIIVNNNDLYSSDKKTQDVFKKYFKNALFSNYKNEKIILSKSKILLSARRYWNYLKNVEKFNSQILTFSISIGVDFVLERYNSALQMLKTHKEKNSIYK